MKRPSNENPAVDGVAECPSDAYLRDSLEEQLPEPMQVSVLDHLDSCQLCRTRLQTLAANEEFWEEASSNLVDCPEDLPKSLCDLQASLQTLTGHASHTLPVDGPSRSGKLHDAPQEFRQLGPYKIMGVVGRGGMGQVYKALDERLNRVVAIKALAFPAASDPNATRRFQREARAAAAIRNEHIVTVYAVEDSAEPPYLAMEYVVGQSLQERINAGPHIDFAEILRIGVQIAHGLAAAHSKGLIHRDIKPANVLLEAKSGRVVITDFGLARAVDDSTITREGTISGTPEYMAPEQTSAGPIDHRADLFSFGSVLYAMCTGERPFRADGSLAVLRCVREDTPMPIQQSRPDAPAALVQIIDRLHCKDPAERYATADEVARDLERVLADWDKDAGSATVSPVVAKGPRKRSRRLTWAVLVASVLVIVAAGVGVTAGLTNVIGSVAGFVQSESPQRPPARQVSITNTRKPRQITPARQFEGHTGPVFDIDFSPDGKLAVSCSGHIHEQLVGDRTVRLWNVSTGEQIRCLNASQIPVDPALIERTRWFGEIYSVDFAPDGQHVAFCGADGLVGLWNVKTGDVVRLFAGHTRGVWALAISPDGKHLLTGGYDRTVRLWNLKTGEELQRLAAHTECVKSLAFSPDGRRALSGSWDKTMRLWDLQNGEQLEVFEGHGEWVWSVCFAPDGRQAISGSERIRLWDLDDGRLLRIYGERETGICARFSPDGRTILAGGYASTLRLWDRGTGRQLASLEGHWNWIRAVEFSTDGRQVLSCAGGTGSYPDFKPGNDFAVRLWQLPQ